MTRRQRLALWGFLASAVTALAAGVAAQGSPETASGLPKGFETRADDYVVQVRQSVWRMDQQISRVLVQSNRIHDGAPNPAEQSPHFQDALTSYMELRDKVLAMLKEAELLPTPTMSTKTRIDGAEKVLEERYQRVLSAFK